MMLALITTLTAFAQDKPITETYKIDNTATSVQWAAKKVIGGGHNGNVSTKEGYLTFTGDIITSGEIIVDMKSITDADMPKTDEYNAKLVGHLKSPDFFNVDKNPEAKLVITSSEKIEKGLRMKGDLTFVGKTNPIEFDAIISKPIGAITAKTKVVLDRTKWDLKYGSADFFKSLGDKAIDNEFTLSIELVAKK
ncbi:MAG: YceI family protein [Bacteriovoracaceae bacterium]|nr:YceI family protein [Bacteriovoracaceae bacterium]